MGLCIGVEVASGLSVNHQLPQVELRVDHWSIDSAGAGGVEVTHAGDLQLLRLQLLDAGKLEVATRKVEAVGFALQIVGPVPGDLRSACRLRQSEFGELDILPCQQKIQVQAL